MAFNCKIDYFSRLLCLVAAALIIISSAFTIATLGYLNVYHFIMAIYHLFFAVVLIGAQFRMSIIIKHFRLLQYEMGKCLYCIIIGFVMFSADGIRFICAIYLVAFGLYHVIPYCIKRSKGEKQAYDPTTQNYIVNQ